jgi:integrase/recombinase XerD
MNKIYLHRYAEKLELTGYAKKSILEYRSALQLFFRYMEDTENVTDIDEITPAHLTAYHAYLQYGKFKDDRFLSNSTIRQRLNAVKAFLRIFHDEGLLSADLSHFITPPKSKKSLPRNVPSVNDMGRLLDTVRPADPITLRDRTLLELLYATGIRAEEVMTLTVDNVNLSEKSLFIHGKGAKDRIVPIGDWVLPWLIEYLETGRPKLLHPRNPIDTLFISKRGNRLFDSNLCWILRKYITSAVLTGHITPHSFRHACATHMLAGGADIRYIQELLGHVDLSTTQIYTRVDISSLKKAHKQYHPRERRDNVE